jgi:predicted nucleic acid-binding protein
VRWIILESVFDETVTWMQAKVSASRSIEVSRVLREEHHYVNLSDEDDAATWEAFCQYADKPWSYTDCSILVIARRLGVFEIFSFDEHIQQMAGLNIVCVP